MVMLEILRLTCGEKDGNIEEEGGLLISVRTVRRCIFPLFAALKKWNTRKHVWICWRFRNVAATFQFFPILHPHASMAIGVGSG